MVEPAERPDPDVLLARVQADEARVQRGKLRIYFGASAGVGKTFAMLNAARRLKEDGVDVVVGVVETHGRVETEAMLEGLDILPRAAIEYRGNKLEEFDIDGALARRPQLLLVDELAHTNAQGARHRKRWQDVEELLAAGINVFSTLNVQHLESLNDVVGGITGVRVWETVPDTFFDAAAEVMLVDVSAEELLARLEAGKVYMPAQAERAIRNFFRKGNLIALRELALRRTAERVEDDVQAYRTDRSIGAIWKTEASLVCCLGNSSGAERLVRSAARLASQLNAEWMAVYVETPSLRRLPEAQRRRVLQAMRLAESLGAKTEVLTGDEVCAALIAFARRRNVSRLVLGRQIDPPLWQRLPWRKALAARIAQSAPELDVFVIGRDTGLEREASAQPIPADSEHERIQRARYAWTAGAVAALTLAATPLAGHLELANIVMLFLLLVVIVAVRFGRGPAVFAAVAGVAAFDFFFVPPRYSFAVSDVQYLVTFGVMLAVGLITGQLTAGLRFQARVAGHREERSRALFDTARELSIQLEYDRIIEISQAAVERAFAAEVAFLLPDDHGRLKVVGDGAAVDASTAQWVYDRQTAAGLSTDTLSASPFLYLPLRAPMRVRGVLAIRPKSERTLLIPEQRQYLDTLASLIGIALERVHYVEVAQQAMVGIESERLRNTLLSALSHDLRTPIAGLVALAESLAITPPPLHPAHTAIVGALGEQARHIASMVTNLLDLARLQSGGLRLSKEWESIEEVAGSALATLRPVMGDHVIETRLPRDLPLVQFDALLIERVLANLIENAIKYTRSGSTIRIEARAEPDALCVVVSDDGPGLAPGSHEAVFEAFTRGNAESAVPGVGLGLALSRAIVQAHGGSLKAEAVAKGARFVMRLPRSEPPAAVFEES